MPNGEKNDTTLNSHFKCTEINQGQKETINADGPEYVRFKKKFCLKNCILVVTKSKKKKKKKRNEELNFFLTFLLYQQPSVTVK